MQVLLANMVLFFSAFFNGYPMYVSEGFAEPVIVSM